MAQHLLQVRHTKVIKDTFEINETIQEFSQLGYDLDSDAAGGLFGWSVSMSANGKVFVVFAPKKGTEGMFSFTNLMKPFKCTHK
jgi:hypothetical protein